MERGRGKKNIHQSSPVGKCFKGEEKEVKLWKRKAQSR